jgi:hypothetical protein
VFGNYLRCFTSLQSWIFIVHRLGINLRRFPHVTNFHIYRWIEQLCWDEGDEGDEDEDEGEQEPYGILPVKIERMPGMILNYSTARPWCCNTLPRDDNKPPPGDYTVILQRGDLSHDNGSDSKSF